MDLTTLADIASCAGFLFAIISLRISFEARKKVKYLQANYLFDKRIKSHLLIINESQNHFNYLLMDYLNNEIEIKKVFVKLITEFESLQTKINDLNGEKNLKNIISKLKKAKNKRFYINNKSSEWFPHYIYKWIKSIGGYFSEDEATSVYIEINENYNRINQIKLDKKDKLK